MPRRILAAMVLVAYVAGQCLAVPHAHAGGVDTEHSGHGARPHVHLSWFGHGDHGRHHGHDCDGEHAHHPGDAHHTCPMEHDSDAVYLPKETGAATLTVKCVGAVGELQFMWAPASATALVLPAGPAAFNSLEIAGGCRSGLPLYLTLRALRI